MSTETTFKTVTDMARGAVMSDHVHFDWTEGYPEEWDYTVACECEKCGRIVHNVHGEDRHSDIDPDTATITTTVVEDGEEYEEEEQCDGYVYSEGPMMGGYWPLPYFSSVFQEGEYRAQELLVDLPVCLVDMQDDDGEYVRGLALTGGGMDLSWELVAAYMRLGYLPPAALYDVPQMAGYDLTPERSWLLDGIAESGRFMIYRGETIVERTEQRRKQMSE